MPFQYKPAELQNSVRTKEMRRAEYNVTRLGYRIFFSSLRQASGENRWGVLGGSLGQMNCWICEHIRQYVDVL